MSVVGEKGPLDAAKSWPQIEWVIQEGKRGTEPTVTAYYGELRILRKAAVCFDNGE